MLGFGNWMNIFVNILSSKSLSMGLTKVSISLSSDAAQGEEWTPSGCCNLDGYDHGFIWWIEEGGAPQREGPVCCT